MDGEERLAIFLPLFVQSSAPVTVIAQRQEFAIAKMVTTVLIVLRVWRRNTSALVTAWVTVSAKETLEDAFACLDTKGLIAPSLPRNAPITVLVMENAFLWDKV